MNASSYVYDYLKSIGREDVISEYNLEPFELNVQAVERTFVDKLFAICDYYLGGKVDEHSRHLYDLYKMMDIVKDDNSLKELFLKVREERKLHKTCLSAQDGVDIKTCIQEIIDKDIYKKNHENITSLLIFDDVDYEIVKNNLISIIRLNYLNNKSTQNAPKHYLNHQKSPWLWAYVLIDWSR